MPFGKFVWRDGHRWLEDQLKRIEGLSEVDPFFKAGLIGGSKMHSARAIQAIRQWLNERGLGSTAFTAINLRRPPVNPEAND